MDTPQGKIPNQALNTTKTQTKNNKKTKTERIYSTKAGFWVLDFVVSIAHLIHLRWS